jgi:Universal stress protein family
MQPLQATLGSRKPWLKHLLFGSVTEEVVRLAHCPVMVVKAPAHQAATPVLKASTKAENNHAG